MLNNFAGLEMSKRALNAFRQGIEVAGHNVTNMDTEGYSRQRVNISTTTPYAAPGLSSPAIVGQIGTGAKLDDIIRIRDEFLDLQYRSELSTLGYWGKVNSLYNTVQLYLEEPAGQGVRVALDSFWDDLQQLQKNPEDPSIRRSVIESAKSLGEMIGQIVQGYDQYASLVNDEVQTAVTQANEILYEVAALNKQIYQLQGLGQNPNDLMDKRDLLLDKLSKMLDVDIQDPYSNGSVTGEFFITLNGRTLVQGDKVRELVAHAFQWENKIYYDVQVRDNEFDIVEDTGVALALATGPEGVHQLNVYRLANGEAWTVGGQDPLCLNDDGTLKMSPTAPPHTIPMRTRPMTATEALGLSTSFRIQVGSQGTQVASKIFNSPNPAIGNNVLGSGQDGETYTFRLGAGDYQADVTVTWDSDPASPTYQKWLLTSDVFNTAGGTSYVSLPTPYPVQTTGSVLTVTELTDFLRSVLPSSGDDGFTVRTGNPPTQFSVGSNNNYLISVSDVTGSLAAQMGMVNQNPVITIDVDAADSLETIRNKINEKYQEAYGLTNPEQWVHAALVQDTDQSWHLSIASDVVGEAQRITLMGDEDGNMQTLRRLGLVTLVQTGETASGDPVYREVTAYSKVAEDASFSFDGVNFLSADNKFEKARRIPAGTNRTDYSAKTLEAVSEGIWLDLKGVGRTAITVRHHVRDGSVKGLEDVRDGLLPKLKGELDELAWALVNSFNAYQYSGYGIGVNANTTGVEFFEALSSKSDAASKLKVSTAVDDDISLIGAASGELDANGKAVSGKSSGEGSGTNAARMAELKNTTLLSGNSASLGSFYEAYLAEIGSKAGHAALMLKTQESLTEQIDQQRQSVMGVNVDEEMLDILKWNQAYNAMARYASTVDEMLDRLINGFGVVGR
ncbi:MAG: flagellar hook-associated protein FlgK [Synergistaceae bacterium]|jgi:flagellar hook-associated protein 1 FlgK|nr:flagellar hook-associated protein FlgK [Synergistaceae bacterium]